MEVQWGIRQPIWHVLKDPLGIRGSLSQAGISYQSHRVEKQSHSHTVKHTVTWKGGVDPRKRALSVWYKSQELTYACTHGFSLKKVATYLSAFLILLFSNKIIFREDGCKTTQY